MIEHVVLFKPVTNLITDSADRKSTTEAEKQSRCESA